MYVLNLFGQVRLAFLSRYTAQKSDIINRKVNVDKITINALQYASNSSRSHIRNEMLRRFEYTIAIHIEMKKQAPMTNVNERTAFANWSCMACFFACINDPIPAMTVINK